MKGKRVREQGKLKFSCYFKKIKDGERVAVVRDRGVRSSFPKRIIGKSGKIITSRGNCKVIEIKDGGKTKTFIIHPIHLKILK